ncbi:MAG: bifunctional D-glycero-beta-D-manno-heptose-7-phosphate kinase/D-glycero-beta-D-manno-heptose 1-phosphate adenylyltransferase HldE [Prolixibacteraceae bacterium]|nr:bifunctional D-glycero-beta-D-manno-heptose-7-phosphate kinase/D-glycero-beta-D-manno-heptose 1-phosphate adenylyltransferase HldE [Prolixibacteraceae bacterium]
MNLKEIQNKSIFIIGDLMIDAYYEGSVNRISPEAPVPIVRVKKVRYVPGGAANVALNLRGLNCNVDIWGIHGKDANGKLLNDLLDKNKIKDHSLETDNPTVTKSRVIGNKQQIVRIDFETENFKIDNEIADQLTATFEKKINNCDIVIISDYGKGVCTEYTCQRIITLCNKYNKKVIVDPKGSNWTKYNRAYMITPNVKEFSEIAHRKLKNEDSILREAGIQLIKELNLNELLITRSEKGMSLICPDGTFKNFDTVAKEVFDVSGAGDTVVATIAACLAANFEINDSISIANKAAGIVVGRIGTTPVSFNELENKMVYTRENEKIVTISELKRILADQRNKKIVFTNGCFDILHKGHVIYLQKAREIGDILIVGLNTDDSVKKIKGPNRPINDQTARATVLSALECVDYVVLFSEDTPYELIKEISPNVLVKGGDYKKEDVVGRDLVDEVKLIDFEKGYSSSNIIKQMKV